MKTLRSLAFTTSILLAITINAYSQQKPGAPADRILTKQPVYVLKIENSDKEAVMQTTDDFALSGIQEKWISRLQVFKDSTSVAKYHTTVENGVVLIVIKKAYTKDLPQTVKDKFKS